MKGMESGNPKGLGWFGPLTLYKSSTQTVISFSHQHLPTTRS